MTLGQGREFISLICEADGSGSLDRPNTFQFRIPVSDASLTSSRLRFTAGTFVFAGARSGDRYASSLHDGDSEGTFELWQSYAMPPQDYRSMRGSYLFQDGRQIVLGLDDRPGEPLYFYVDKEQVVRLYPLSPDSFLSEHSELLTFAASEESDAISITLLSDGGKAVRGQKLEWRREEQMRIPVQDFELAGTLLLPQGEGPFPLVIFCHLADTHTRDYYRLFAEPFVERGIAAFVYDKRGRGESTGPQLFSEFFSLADDASAVFDFMQQHPSVRADRVGLWGISNGAWVAALAASRVEGAALVVEVSASGVSPARQEQVRRKNVAKSLGASPRVANLIERFWMEFFKFYIDGEWNDELESLLLELYEDEEVQRLPKHPDHAPGLQPVPPIMPIEKIRAEAGGAWKEGGFELAPILAGLRCPVLCLWGAEDSVLPVEESMERIEQALLWSHHPDFTLRVIPEATHQFYLVTPPPTGILSEVMHTHLHNVSFVPGVREMMADWAAERVGL